MRKIDLAIAVQALFRQELTRTQIAKELKICVEDVDEALGIFVFDDNAHIKIFRENFKILTTPLMELEELPLSVRNKLDRQSIYYLWKAIMMSKKEIMKIKSFGKICFDDFDDYLTKTLLDGIKKTEHFYTKYPNGITFNEQQIRALKESSNETL